MNEQILIKTLPSGKLSADNYERVASPMPEIQAGEVLVKTNAFAITAGTRAGLQGSASYAGAPTTGIVMGGTGVGTVVATNSDAVQVGDQVLTSTGWQQYSVQKPANLELIPAGHDPLHYLGPMGVNGLTAYFGLLSVGEARACLLYTSPSPRD